MPHALWRQLVSVIPQSQSRQLDSLLDVGDPIMLLIPLSQADVATITGLLRRHR